MTRANKCTRCTSSIVESCTVDTMGRHHSYDDKPARVFGTETNQWYFQDLFHRVHAPAIVATNKLTMIDHEDKGMWYYYGQEVIVIPEDSLHIGKAIVIERMGSCD